jgi:hypothetical protein
VHLSQSSDGGTPTLSAFVDVSNHRHVRVWTPAVSASGKIAGVERRIDPHWSALSISYRIKLTTSDALKERLKTAAR